MQLVTRADLGWPESAAPLQPTTLGVKVHYEGTPVSTNLLTDHSACLREWQNIRASHLANTAEGYVDVAYNYAACPHGYLLEGRGIGRRTGANGNQPLNKAHYAIVGLVGSEGLTDPTPEMLGAIRDGIELLQANGAGGEIRGHRDGYATDCPGGPLYAWVQAGAPRPDGSTPAAPAPTPAPSPQSSAPAFPGRLLVAYSGAQMLHGDDVREWQQRMADRGWRIAVDGWYGGQSAGVCRQFQEDSTANGWPLDADGVVGPKTWRASWDRPVS